MKRGYARWRRALLKMGSTAMLQSLPLNDPAVLSALNEQLASDLLGKKSNAIIPPAERTPLLDFMMLSLYEFVEIDRCKTAMQTVEFFLRRFPYKETEVSRPQYLRYHIEHFLHEVFILRERLNGHLTRIERAYRRDTRSQRVQEKIASTRAIVRGALESVTGIRSEHVHHERFNTDELKQLDLMSFFDEFEKGVPAYRAAYTRTLRDVRKTARRMIEANNKQLASVLNHVGEALLEIMFAGKMNAFTPPTNIAPRVPRSGAITRET